jgi:flagellar motor component MotA
MKRFSWIPWLVAIGLIVLTVLLEGGNLLWFISPSAFTVCVGITFVLLLMQYTPVDMCRIHGLVRMGQSANKAELETAVAYFAAMRRFLLASGLVGVGMGAVHVMAGLGRLSNEALGEAIAVSLIALVYAGFGILLVALPGETAAKKKLAMLQ